MSKWTFFFLLAGMLSAPVPATAQDTPNVAVSDSTVEVRLADGSTLFGKIIAVNATDVTVRTTAGVQVVVPRSSIRSIRALQGATRDNGEVWPEDANGVRLFLTPTGRTLPAGRAQFGVLELFFPFLSYGASDRFTITVGTPVLPGAIGQVFYVAPKFEIVRGPKAHISASVLGFLASDNGDFGSAGILYGVGTFGTTDKAVTVGAGFPFYAGEGDNELAERPVFILGGESRTSRRVKLITETLILSYRETDYNYQTGQYNESTHWDALISGGLRFIGDRISADFGLGFAAGEGGGCCLPLVNFAYTFGKR